MRILLYNWKDLAHPAAGGAEVYTHEVLRRWAAWGHEVTLFTAAVAGRPGREAIDGVRVVRRGGRLGVYREARRFYEREGRGAFDLVIDEVNTRPFGSPSFVRDAPVVALIHQVAREVWFSELPLPVAVVGRFVLEPHWLASYRRVPALTVSESSRRSLEDYGLERVQVVPIGNATPLQARVVKDRRPTVVFVGRLAANKRPDAAVAAFALLRRRMPDARLWLVGTGPLEARLRRAAGPGVTVWGHVSHARKLALMSRAHVLVATSVREGWGLIVDEAAAAGTPSVGYDVAGLRDSVPAAGGVLVPPHPEALAAELARRLPGWVADPPRAGWVGGARSWDDVAAAVLHQASTAVEAPEGAVSR